MVATGNSLLMRSIAILSLLLLAALIAAALALRSQAVVLSLTHWALDRFTSVRLEVEEPVIDVYQGLLAARELHLIPKGSDGPPLLSVLGLSVTTTLSDILANDLAHSDLRAKQVTIYVAENDAAEDPAPTDWLQYISWLPRGLQVDQLHVITASEKTLILPLKALIGERTAARQYRISADADYEGEPLGVTLDLLAVREEERFTGLSLRGRFLAPESGSRILLEGELRGTEEDFTYDLGLDADYQDVGAFLKGFQIDRSIGGTLSLQARMRGDTSGFVLSDAKFLLDNMPEYGFEAAGRLEYQGASDNRVELSAAGELASLGYLADWLGPAVGELGRAQASLELSGTLERPVIDEFVLHTSSEDGLAVSLSGRLEPSPADSGDTVAHNEVWIDASGPSLTVLDDWLEPPSLDPGPWFGSGRLTGDGHHIKVNDLDLELGSVDATRLSVRGSIENVAGVAERGLAGLEGIRLEVEANVADSVALGQLLQREIPPDHHASAGFQLHGDGTELHIRDGRANLAATGLEASLLSGQAVLYPSAESHLQGLSGRISMAVADTSELSKYLETDIPSLGPLNISGELAQRDATFQLSDVTIDLQGGEVTALATGRVANLADFSGVALATRFSRLDTRSLILRFLEDFDYQGQLGQLGGRFNLSNPSGTWRVTNLNVESSEADGALALSAAATLDNFTGQVTGNLSATYHLRDPALLEALTALRMNPAAGTLVVRSETGKLRIETRTRIGDTTVAADGDISYDKDAISRLEVAATIPHLHLKDLGLQAGTSGTGAYKPIEQLDEEMPVSRLERLLAKSPRYETDMRLTIDGITGDKTNINSANLHVTGENNRYTLRRFSITYAQSDAEIRGIIDLNPNPPALSLAGQALLIPLDTLAADLGADVDIKGILTLQGGITASGKTGDDLLRTLAGSIALALEDAVIEGAAYDVLATDFLGWVYSGAMMEKYTDVECTMAKFQLIDGVARSDSLYIETDKMLATGQGKFDLVAKKLDVTITPLSKSRVLQVPSSVRLKGSFANPTPIISPVSAAADAYAQVLTALPQLAMKLFGVSRATRKEQRPCAAP